jgi:predicted SprT family Zn-dependent metalloprotease
MASDVAINNKYKNKQISKLNLYIFHNSFYNLLTFYHIPDFFSIFCQKIRKSGKKSRENREREIGNRRQACYPYPCQCRRRFLKKKRQNDKNNKSEKTTKEQTTKKRDKTTNF